MCRLFFRRSLLVLATSAGAGFSTLFAVNLLRRVREEEQQMAKAEAEALGTASMRPQTPLRTHAREAARDTFATVTRPVHWAVSRTPFGDQLTGLRPIRRLRSTPISRESLRHTPEAAWATARRAPETTRAVADRVQPAVRTLRGQATGLLTRLRCSPDDDRGGSSGEA